MPEYLTLWSETVGGSIEIGKRWDIGKLFLEPQGQLAGA